MTSHEIKDLKSKDDYLVERKAPPEWELRLFLYEVKYKCPLCGKLLQHRHQKKLDEKLFQIAHIYPNKPTDYQYKTLFGLERLGTNCESYENRIALCKNCHGTQDSHTTKEEYLNLVSIKKRLSSISNLEEITNSLNLEKELSNIISILKIIKEKDLAELKYKPTKLANKFELSEFILKNKVSSYVTMYFPFVRDEFKKLEQNSDFVFSTLCCQIKACFMKLNKFTKDKNIIFEKIVEWIQTRTLTSSTIACEIIVSYFIQNCEVFDEITKQDN